MTKKRWAVAILLVSMLFVSACGSKQQGASWDEIKKKGELVIGVDDTFVPMGFKDDSGKLVGFDIDLASDVTKQMGVKAKFQPIDWSMKESELKNGTIDVIWNGYTVTDARKKSVDFSDYYLTNEQVLVVNPDNGIKTFADMKGKTLGAQEGSSGEELLENNPEMLKDYIKDNEAVLFPTFTEGFLDLKAGRIDGLLIDKVFADYYIAKQADMKGLVIIPSEFENENFAIGVRKGDSELLKVINDGLAKSTETGTAQKISQKWFGDNRIIINR